MPSAGVEPSGVETMNVAGAQVFVVELIVVEQVLRSKTSEAPDGFGAVAPRLVEFEVNETYSPSLEIDGCSLLPLPGVTPSAVETR